MRPVHSFPYRDEHIRAAGREWNAVASGVHRYLTYTGPTSFAGSPPLTQHDRESQEVVRGVTEMFFSLSHYSTQRLMGETYRHPWNSDGEPSPPVYAVFKTRAYSRDAEGQYTLGDSLGGMKFVWHFMSVEVLGPGDPGIGGVGNEKMPWLLHPNQQEVLSIFPGAALPTKRALLDMLLEVLTDAREDVRESFRSPAFSGLLEEIYRVGMLG